MEMPSWNRRIKLTYRPLTDDGKPDIAGYNKELEELRTPSWFNVPWLYAECYLYRCVILHP